VFPDGIVVDFKNRTYLTSKVNSLFLAKSQFQRVSEGSNKKHPTKNDEESSLVAGTVLFGLRPHESRKEVLYYQKPALASLVSVFLFPIAYKNKFLTLRK